MRCSLAGLAGVVSLLVASLTTVVLAQPAAPRVTVVSEVVNGVRIDDPYRWMESGGAELDAWARAEAEHARAELDAIPGRAELYRRIAALDTPSAGITGLQVRNDRWLYRRVDAGHGEAGWFTRDGRDAVERPIDFLAALPAAEGPWSEVAAARVLSPDGRFLTFGTTQRGEENPTLRVFDVEQRRLLDDEVKWPLWADSDGFRPRWLADSSGFLYVRRADVDAGMDDVERARRGQVFLHRLGAGGTDRALFGHGLTPEITDTDTLYVQGEPHPRWLPILRRMPEGGRELWVVDLTALDGPGLPPARRVYASDVLVRGYGVQGDWLYTLDATDSPRFRLVRFDLAPERPGLEVALPQQEGVLADMAVGGDAVYVVERLLSRARIHVVSPSGARAVELAEGAVDTLEVGPEGRGAWLTQVDWLSPRRGWLLQPGAGAVSDPGLSERPPAPVAGFASRLDWAIARDGERIPFTIVQAAGENRSGAAYAIIDGYGCFGSVDTPFYWPGLVAWLERGGVFVRAGLRGGGELGAQWHLAGRDRNKPTAFEDAIDVAKHLVRAGVTQPGRIGVRGGSCGGITMGMAALEAPHLVGAAVLSVGAFDLWRMADLSAAGARSVRDVGDPATAEGARRILALSPYMQLLAGAPRPALLIASGATDYAIPLWVGGKMVARSRAALPDGKPVLWKIEWEAGHNAGADYTQEDADLFAFMFWQLGHPDFQPRSAGR